MRGRVWRGPGARLGKGNGHTRREPLRTARQHALTALPHTHTHAHPPQTAWTRRHTAVLTSTGRLAVWGHGYYGQLGTGRIEDRPAPTLLGGALADARVCAVACGDRHTACASADGRLYTWGDGSLGALGHGDTDGRLQPAEVRALSGVKRVAVVSCCADHTAVCTADGCVYTWGAGAFGQLGHGDTGSKLVPCQVLGELRGRHVATVATGNCHTAALTKEGHLFAWGDATFGQLGLGGTEGKLAPQRVGADLLDLATKSVACGHYHTVAATRDGLVFAWGDNQQGQLGLGCREGRRQPSRVAGRLAQHTARAMACGDCHSVVLTEADERGQRRVLSFGSGTFGQTGLGHTHDTLEPTEVEGLPPASHVFALSCGATHTCVVTENWRVFAWGAVSGQDRIFREPSEVVDLAGRDLAQRGGPECHSVDALFLFFFAERPLRLPSFLVFDTTQATAWLCELQGWGRRQNPCPARLADCYGPWGTRMTCRGPSASWTQR